MTGFVSPLTVYEGFIPGDPTTLHQRHQLPMRYRRFLPRILSKRMRPVALSDIRVEFATDGTVGRSI